MKLFRRLLMVVYLLTLCILGGAIGWHWEKSRRARTSTCQPCQAATAAPGMGVSNP